MPLIFSAKLFLNFLVSRFSKTVDKKLMVL